MRAACPKHRSGAASESEHKLQEKNKHLTSYHQLSCCGKATLEQRMGQQELRSAASPPNIRALNANRNLLQQPGRSEALQRSPASEPKAPPALCSPPASASAQPKGAQGFPGSCRACTH